MNDKILSPYKKFNDLYFYRETLITKSKYSVYKTSDEYWSIYKMSDEYWADLFSGTPYNLGFEEAKEKFDKYLLEKGFTFVSQETFDKLRLLI